MTKAYLLEKQEKLRNAIAFGVNRNGNLAYARALLARVEQHLAHLT